MIKWNWLFTLTLAMSMATTAGAQQAQILHFGDDTIEIGKQVSPLVEQALQAYVYGYTPLYFDVSMKTYTNVAKPSENPNQMWAPVNQFFHGRRQQTAENTMGVAPNSDTLYTMAYLDLSNGPIVWHLPAWPGHYYVCPIHNQWADNISVGNRTNPGPIEVDYAVTGKDWHGTLPPGVRRIQMDSDHAMILCRIQQDFDPASLASAHEFQDGMTLTPLSEWRKGARYTPPVGTVDPAISPWMGKTVPQQILAMDPQTFFSRVAQVLSINPPTQEDAEAVAVLRSFGIVQGQPFDLSKLSPEKQDALRQALTLGPLLLKRALGNLGPRVNGWPYALVVGRYQEHYLKRAAAAQFGFSGNMMEDNMQSINLHDATGAQLNGDKRYTIHFAPGMTPPVDGFWSFTVYTAGTYDIFAPKGRNPIGNHDNTNPLHFNPDGSLDIYVQPEPTGDPAKDRNWLATPKGTDFLVYFPTYGPHPAIYSFSSATGLPSFVVPALEPVGPS
jgi:hypothetical protein